MRDWHHDTQPDDKWLKVEATFWLVIQILGIVALTSWAFV